MCPLLILLKLLTLLLQLSTCNVEILPLVIKGAIRLLNLATLSGQLLLTLIKGCAAYPSIAPYISFVAVLS